MRFQNRNFSCTKPLAQIDMKKKIIKYGVMILILLIIITLLLNKLFIYALILGAISIIGKWIHSYIKKYNEKRDYEFKRVTRENETLREQYEDVKNRKFNIASITNILELNLQEIETNFTRTWNFVTIDKKRFIGALKYNVIAKYGIDLKEIKIKIFNDLDTIQIANINPKFLSFTDLEPKWEICELTETKKPLFGNSYQRTSDKLEREKSNIKEQFQQQTYREIKSGPKELQWMIEPLKEKIINTMSLFLNSNGKSIEIVESYDETFVSLSEFNFGNNEDNTCANNAHKKLLNSVK